MGARNGATLEFPDSLSRPFYGLATLVIGGHAPLGLKQAILVHEVACVRNLTEEQMTGSEKYVSGSFRYERIDGAGHFLCS